MKPGDVVLTPLSQSDGVIKNRPVMALCQMPPFGDWLVCGASTQLHHQVVEFDEIIGPADDDFVATGLKAASLIRLGFLAVAPASRLLGVIGSISEGRRRRLLQTLSRYFQRN